MHVYFFFFRENISYYTVKAIFIYFNGGVENIGSNSMSCCTHACTKKKIHFGF